MARIVIPRNAEKLLHLAENINKKHKTDGTKSPLNTMEMSKFDTRITDAGTALKEAKELEKAAEKKTEMFQKLLGVHTSQKTTNAGHLIYQVTQSRDILRGIYRSTLRKLGDWGFVVNK